MKIFISHINQAHDNSRNSLIEGEQFEKVALSQFNSAQAIIARPKAKVVSESLTRNHTAADLSQYFSEEVAIAKHLFPQGLPDNFLDLTYEQKLFLVKQGGDLFVFFMGIIPDIYKSIDEQLGGGLFTFFGAGLLQCSDIYSLREIQAIEKIRELAENSEEDSLEILLKYGLGHDFEHLIKSLNHPSYIFIENIETVEAPDVSFLRLKQLIDLLNQTLGAALSEEYGDRWMIIPYSTHFHAIRGYIYGSEQKIDLVYQQIDEKLKNSSFNHDYSLTKEVVDKNLDEWYIRLEIKNADLLLSQIIADKLRSVWKESEKIPFELRRAIRQKKFQEYALNNVLDDEVIIAIHRDQALRDNLSPSDFVLMGKKQPEYFKVLLNNPSILQKILKNQDCLSEIVQINASIIMSIIENETYREIFLDTAKRELIMHLSTHYLDFANQVIEDVMMWRHFIDLSENDFVDIVRAHPSLANSLLEATDYCDEPFIEDPKNRDILIAITNVWALEKQQSNTEPCLLALN